MGQNSIQIQVETELYVIGTSITKMLFVTSLYKGETSRMSTLSGSKSIPLGQLNWVYTDLSLDFSVRQLIFYFFLRSARQLIYTHNLYQLNSLRNCLREHSSGDMDNALQYAEFEVRI